MSDKPTLDYKQPSARRPFAERPAVAAIIVFSPIGISVILLIVYVLSHRQ